MTDENTELLKAFGDEIRAVRNELEPVFQSLKLNPNQPRLIEKFGQVIDRIYGTAATLGFKELADYCLAVKTVCYKCSQSGNLYAYSNTKDLLVVCFSILGRVADGVQDPRLMRQLRKPFADETEKARTFLKKTLGTIGRGSVAA